MVDSAEYYKNYVDLLASSLIEGYSEAMLTGQLSGTFNKTVISEILKKGKDLFDPTATGILVCRVLTAVQYI